MNKKKILLNMAQCRKCKDVIQSTYRHDFKCCRCGAIHVDGGHDYIKRGAKDLNDIVELSKYEEDRKDLETIEYYESLGRDFGVTETIDDNLEL